VDRSWEIDFEASVARFEHAGGLVTTMPMRIAAPRDVVRRSRIDFVRGLVALTLDDGELLEVELGQPRQKPPDGVPIVYLDQNHWIRLAQRMSAPDKVPAFERDAADRLIELGRDGQILLPVSAAHLTELPPGAGRRRRELGQAILGLSRGWQLRNPVHLRGQEYVEAMHQREPLAIRPVTLDPGVLFTAGPSLPEPMQGVPPEISELIVRVIAVSAVYSAILAAEPIDRTVVYCGHEVHLSRSVGA
jgi:hypothetical protein